LDPLSEWNTSRLLVIAHRGASQRAPENTLAAFRLASTLGADGIELDTKLTADGEAIVMHDQTIDRTTSGVGRVRDHTVAELKRLEAGSHFGPEFAGEPIPSLEEVFQELVESPMLINVEVGNYASPQDRLPDRVVELVQQYGLDRRVLISSFNPIALRRTRNQAPGLALALLLVPAEPGWQRFVFSVISPRDADDLNDAMIRPEVVARSHRAGRRCLAWTVNEAARMHELVTMGVDGIITDAPDVARQVVDGAASKP